MPSRLPSSLQPSSPLIPSQSPGITSDASLQFLIIFQTVMASIQRRNIGKRPSSFSNTRGVQQQFSCDFENGWCPGFFHNKSSALEWQIHQGPGYNSYTGPDVDHTTLTADGKYAYFNGSKGGIKQTASFLTPLVNMNQSLKYCLSFWYHMKGVGYGSLEVFWKFPAVPSNSTGFEYRIFSRKVAGSLAGNDWKEVRIAVYSPLAFRHISPVLFEFRATKGVHRRNDIAIDDITLSIGDCGNCTERIRSAFNGRNNRRPIDQNHTAGLARFHACPHSGYLPRMCGEKHYDASSHTCCQNKIRLGTGPCCGEKVMVYEDQQCCGGHTPYRPGQGRGCCNGRMYFKFFHECCNNIKVRRRNRQNACLN